MHGSPCRCCSGLLQSVEYLQCGAGGGDPGLQLGTATAALQQPQPRHGSQHRLQHPTGAHYFTSVQTYHSQMQVFPTAPAERLTFLPLHRTAGLLHNLYGNFLRFLNSCVHLLFCVSFDSETKR